MEGPSLAIRNAAGIVIDYDAVFGGITLTGHAINVASNLSVYKLLRRFSLHWGRVYAVRINANPHFPGGHSDGHAFDAASFRRQNT